MLLISNKFQRCQIQTMYQVLTAGSYYANVTMNASKTPVEITLGKQTS